MNRQELLAINRRRLKIVGILFAVFWLYGVVSTFGFALEAIPGFFAFAPIWYPWLTRKWSPSAFRSTTLSIFFVLPLLVALGAFIYLGVLGQESWGLGVWIFLWILIASITIAITYFVRADDPDLLPDRPVD